MASVVEVGVHTRELDRRHADRVLPVTELIVVQSGMLPIAEEGRQFAVRQGEWVLLEAGRRHYGYDVMGRDTWFFWVVFGHQDGDIFRTVQRGRRSGLLARPDRVQILFEQMLEDQQAAILTPDAADSYLRLLVAEILLEPSTASGGPASLRLARRAAAFIAQHLTDPDLSTARIARELACNRDYLGRTFREAFNETPTDRIHRLRIARACMLFRSTDRPIERVATDVGFGGVRYFRRVFKGRVGLSPGQFQRLRPSGERR
jgi:AraC-like DNA-binding protein